MRLFCLSVRDAGIGPASSVWKTDVLPLNESRGLEKHTLNPIFAETPAKAYIHPMRSLGLNLGALVLIGAGFFLLLSRPITEPVPLAQIATTSAEISSVAKTAAATSTAVTSTKSVQKAATAPVQKALPAAAATTSASTPPSNTASRIQNPYSFPPLSSDALNIGARGALVNILCMPRGGSLSPTSGSGVIIDPRGVILTNAHVAQYVLLSEDPRVDLSCTIRTGAPATARWVPEVLYIPTIWVNAHVSDILNPHPTGTGEHDYALLAITGSVDNSPLPAAFPYLPFDTRQAVAFQGDSVLVASYPAELIGGITTEYNLFPVSSVATIGQLLTFTTNSIDVFSLGGIIEAQGGSSGGVVVNVWGQLVGIIATTSAGATTVDRDLHALALSYINTDIMAQSGIDLAGMLNGNILGEALTFNTNTAPQLIQLYIDQLSKPH